MIVMRANRDIPNRCDIKGQLAAFIHLGLDFCFYALSCRVLAIGVNGANVCADDGGSG